MSKLNSTLLFLSLLLHTSVLINVVNAQTSLPSSTIASGDCVQPFDTFAFHESIDGEKISSPIWEIESTIPSHQIEDFPEDYRDFDVALTRSMNGHQEVWLIGQLWKGSESKPIIIIYRSEFRDWVFLTSAIGDTGLYVKDLFVDTNGTVWGRTTWKTDQDYSYLRNFSVLSKFDEITRHFEFAEGAPEIPLQQKVINDGQTTYQYDPETRIVLDHNNIFWIFVQFDGLYRYDPNTQTAEKQVSLSNEFIGNTALSIDGTIYFTKWGDDTDVTARELFSLSDGILFQFIPKTREIISVDTPNEGWPSFSGMLVDYAGRLWLGSVGYRDTDDTWHLIHPDPEKYFDHAGDYTWKLPSPILASSDGILWFKKYIDTGGWQEGMAWFDPNTGQGCMFTNVPTTIVEDSIHQLWLLAGGTIYKLKLNTQ